jgi:hypothetical protein
VKIPGYCRAQLKGRGILLGFGVLVAGYGSLEIATGSGIYRNYMHQPVFAASVIALGLFFLVAALLPWPSELPPGARARQKREKPDGSSRTFEKNSPLNDWEKW